DRFRTVADTFENERATFGAPGAALLVLERGDVSFARGFGQKGPRDTDLVHATTLFRIGSVTKALTAVLLLQLVDTQMIDLDSSLARVVPNFAFRLGPEWAWSIRVR